MLTLLIMQVAITIITVMSLQIAWGACKLLDNHLLIRNSGEEIYKRFRGKGELKELSLKKNRIIPLKYAMLFMSMIMAIICSAIIIDIITIVPLITTAWYIILLLLSVSFYVFVDGARTQAYCDLSTMQYNHQKVTLCAAKENIERASSVLNETLNVVDNVKECEQKREL